MSENTDIMDDISCTTCMYNMVDGHREFFEDLVSVESRKERYAWWDDKRRCGDGYVEEFYKVVSTYQEQPHLLDVVLERVVEVLSSVMMDCIQSTYDGENGDAGVLAYVSRCLWKLSSVRGYKTIVRCLPCDVYYVEPLFRFLHGAHTVQRQVPWECDYCVLMWSYHLTLVPFQFDVIDSSIDMDSSGGDSCRMVDCIIDVCKERLQSASAVRDMAAVCLGRLLTRPDMTTVLLDLGAWGEEILGSPKMDDHRYTQFIVPGIMLTMATVFKLGKPGDQAVTSLAMRFVVRAAKMIHAIEYERNQLARTLCMKIIQRGALLCILQDDVCQDSENIQEVLEVSIDALLSGMGDPDTVVRWSSAKGIARIAAKLEVDFADQIIASIIEMMRSVVASENTWHGGCLAIAELTRRNLIATSHISDLLPIIQEGLTYEVRRGFSSVGTNVRDAASYVCWALARTQTKNAMSVAFQDLAPVLMASACYDREINCRRAAAAAFQECVGRLGDIPHGIDILTVADFFTVSLRKNAFIQVAPQVASFPGFHSVFAHHLLEKKLTHWEKSLRELAAEALAALVPIDVCFHKNVSMQHLIEQSSSKVLENRHGAVCALGCILPELFARGNEDAWLDRESQHLVAGIIPMLIQAGVLKGVGGEVMRSALCRLVWSMSQVRIPLQAEQISCMYSFCRENISHTSEGIQREAAKALSGIIDVYVSQSSNPIDPSTILDEFIHDLHPDLHYGARRGAALAFGKFPSWIIARRPAILDALLESMEIEDNRPVNDVEARVYGIQSIPHVLHSITGDAEEEIQVLLERTIDSLLGAMEDYSSDNRGDIGSWVREAAACTGLDILCMYPPRQYGLGLLQKSRLLVCKVARLTLERIGRVRQNAGKHLQRCLGEFSNDLDLGILLQKVSTISEDELLDGKAFSRVINCCTSKDPIMMNEIVLGATYAIGGLDISLQEFTAEHLVAYLDTTNEETNKAFKDAILTAWQRNLRSARLSIPFIQTADILLSRTSCIRDQDFVDTAIGHIETVACGSGDVAKLCKTAELLGTITAEDAYSQTAISLLIRLMGKKYPNVRKYAAEQLYTAMLVWDEDDIPDHIQAEEARVILEETPWQGPASIVRPAREQLSLHLGIALPR